MQRVCTVPSALLLLLLATLARSAGGQATLKVCNKGTATVQVVVATQSLGQDDLRRNGFGGHHWAVQGAEFSPGSCEIAYREHGSYGYIGFAFSNASGRLIAGVVRAVPDFGFVDYDNPIRAAMAGARGRDVLASSDVKLCARSGETSYRTADENLPTAPSCAAVRENTGGATGSVLVNTLRFFPEDMACSSSLYGTACGGGAYYLNISANPASGEVTATRASREGEDELGVRAEPASSRETNPAESSVLYVSAFDPFWVGKVRSVRGTVSRIRRTADGVAREMHFQESLNDAFVVCARPDMVGDVDRYVGKKVEVRGHVVSHGCGGDTSKVASLILNDQREIRQIESSAGAPAAPAAAAPQDDRSKTDRRAAEPAPTAAPLRSSHPQPQPAASSAGEAVTDAVIRAGARLLIKTIDNIDVLHGDQTRLYRAQLAEAVALVSGASLPQGTEVLLRLWRGKPLNAQGVSVSITVEAVKVSGRSLRVATTPFSEVVSSAAGAHADAGVKPGTRLTFVAMGGSNK